MAEVLLLDIWLLIENPILEKKTFLKNVIEKKKKNKKKNKVYLMKSPVPYFSNCGAKTAQVLTIFSVSSAVNMAILSIHSTYLVSTEFIFLETLAN